MNPLPASAITSKWSVNRRDGCQKLFSSVLIAVGTMLMAVFAAPSALAQTYGPPNIELYGTLYTYSSTGLDSTGTMADVYEDQYGDPVFVDADLNFLASWGQIGTYDPGSFVFTVPQYTNAAAVGADGSSFLGLPLGVVVKQSNVSYLQDQNSNYPAFYFLTSDGVTYLSKYLNVPTGDCFEIGSSPWYQFAGTGDMFIDATNAWPAGIFAVPPQVIYVNGQAYYLSTDTPVGGVQYVSENVVYENWDTQETAGINRGFTSGSYSGAVWGYVNGSYFTGSYDPVTWAVSGIPAGFALSFSTPAGVPSVGPSYISWSSVLLLFSFTDSQGTDYYEDSTATYLAEVSSGNDVTVSNPSGATSGEYNPTTSQFDFAGDPNMADFFAMDMSGIPQGLPAGVTMLFGANTSGQGVMEGDGTVVGPTYTFQQPGGSWGVKYVGLPDGPFLVQDSNQTYTSPLFSYRASLGNVIINATGGWPATNAYPTQLVINGVSCALVSGSITDSGGAPPGRSGHVTYSDQASDVSAMLSWTWNTQFQGALQVSYGTTGSYTGTWDGAVTFGGFPAGFMVGTVLTSSGPQTGPPQIFLNGIPLKFVPGASGGFNVQNADVYRSASGIQISISPSGSVTLTRRDGSQVFGTYNAASKRFNFGGQSVGIIAATDSAGKTLNTLIEGGASTATSGGLDVQGNILTLGNWTGGSGSSAKALILSYTDGSAGQPALVNFDATRSSVGWVWGHSVTDGSANSAPALTLDAANRLLVYAPGNSTSPNIILDPVGASGFASPLRVTPQGGLPMGTFQTGPTPP